MSSHPPTFPNRKWNQWRVWMHCFHQVHCISLRFTFLDKTAVSDMKFCKIFTVWNIIISPILLFLWFSPLTTLHSYIYIYHIAFMFVVLERDSDDVASGDSGWIPFLIIPHEGHKWHVLLQHHPPYCLQFCSWHRVFKYPEAGTRYFVPTEVGCHEVDDIFVHVFRHILDSKFWYRAIRRLPQTAAPSPYCRQRNGVWSRPLFLVPRHG